MENITAEEFFRAKIKELNPIQMVVTLANETISGEQGLRWAHEFKELHTTTLQADLEKAKELIRKYQDREQVLAQQLDDYLVENHEMKKTLVAAKRTIEKLVVWADVASEDRKQFYEVIDKTLSSYNDNEKNKLTTFLEEK